jgi:hypothetical protein
MFARPNIIIIIIFINIYLLVKKKEFSSSPNLFCVIERYSIDLHSSKIENKIECLL